MPTQNTDVSGTPDGITYAGPGLVWKIAKGVDVEGTFAGVRSDFTNSKLINNGSVFGPTVGVYFNGPGDNLVVVNNASGDISGSYGVAITSYTGSALVQNYGNINATGTAAVYLIGSSESTIENSGRITGINIGVVMQFGVSGAPAEVDNRGTIDSPIAIYILSATGSLVNITNHDGAKIKGSNAALYSAEQTKLINDGKMVGNVLLGSYDDKVVNKGKMNGDVQLGIGEDVLKLKGSAKAGLIDSGYGNDKLVLADKADSLLFDSALSAAANVDTIKKFASGKDAIYLDDDIFTAITPGTLSSAAFHKGTSAADADDRIIYDKKSGALYYDPDGTGALAQTQFAKFDGGPKLKASDFSIGEYSIV